MGVDQVDFVDDISKALMVWAIDPKPAGDVALARLNKLRTGKKPIPKELIALLAKAKNPGALPIVEELWVDDTTGWESLLADFGPIAEPGVLARFSDLEGVQRHSAAMILGRIGTRKSLPVLQAARSGAEPEMAVLIDDAVRAINQR
jgi:HEAT repeat protein